MKKFICLSVIFIVLLCTGCIFSNDKKKEEKPKPEYSAEEYFPLIVGATWEYKETSHSKYGNDIKDYYEIISSKEIIDGKTYYSRNRSDVNGYKEYYRISGDIIYFKYAYSDEDEFLKWNFNLPVGEIHHLYKIKGNNYTDNYFQTLVSTDATIIVSAGIFQKCLVFETKCISEFFYSYEDKWVIWTHLKTYWFAPGVGLVKHTYNRNFGEFTVVKMLLSYSIKN